MKLIDDLMARAATADAVAGEIATREEAAERRRQAYGRLEQTFNDLAADGLDRAELERLMTAFRAQGLDTTQLSELHSQLRNTDATARVPVTTELRDAIGEQLSDAKARTRDPSLGFQAQQAMSEYHQSFDLASRVSKAEHEIYMAAIRHLVA